jgi:hypothetical protein
VPLRFDATGLEQVDRYTWWDPRTGDGVVLTPIGLPPDLPPFLNDLPRLRWQLAMDEAAYGTLIEADVVYLDGVAALYQLKKLPLPNRPAGVGYIASFTVPRATCSIVLKVQATEGEHTGFRESMVAGEIGPMNLVRQHPYAPDLQWLDSDDARWDARFPDHPLTRVRAWARRIAPTIRLDPRLGALAPFPPPPGVSVPQPVQPPRPTGPLDPAPVTVLTGLPIGDLVALHHEDGGTSFWQVTEPDVLLDLLGTVTRVELAGRGSGEVAVLDHDAGRLSARRPDGTEAVVGVRPADPAQALATYDVEAFQQSFTRVGGQAMKAATRQECLTVGIGGRYAPSVPFAMMTLRLAGGEWEAYVRTCPIPLFAARWSEYPVDGDTQVLTAPGIDEGMMVAMAATFEAIGTWGSHPLQLAVSYARHPDF